MRIAIKRAYDPPGPSDGKRVLVDRLWPRGLSRERAAIDAWMKEIAPSQALRTWFGHREERWEDFREAYLEELESQPEHLAELEKLCRREPVTLVFAARDEERNNAAVLKEFLVSRLGSTERARRRG